MNKYPAYKDSGVEWIGKIPTHWTISRIKNAIAYAINGIWGDDPKGNGRDIICIRVADFEMKRFGVSQTNLTYRCIPIQNDDQRILRKSDLLIEKSGGGEKQPVGRVISYNLNDNAVSSNFIAKISPNKDIIDSRFLLYYFNVCYSFGINNLSIKQTTGIQNLDTTHYFNNPCCFPPVPEQSKIASFLDHKTHHIDDLIAKKQKLIELLEEERTALINQAVTKGLDPAVTMKDSGIEWLGIIPEHWDLTNIKQITTKIGSGVTPKGGAEIYVEKGIPFFRSQNIHFSGINTDEIAFIPTDVHENMSASKMYKDDVLLNITGASIGRCCVYEGQLGEANVNQHVCILRTTTNVNPYFLYYFLSSEVGQIQIDLGITGSGREGLNFKNIGNFVFPMIPSDEQKQIVQYLNEINKSIESVMIKAYKEIELLSEYKTSLINEAVTGKIDVRDYQINHA
jgi:type I restriction enzyme S subunit